MDVEKLCLYQVWADDKVRDMVRELTEEEFTRTLGPPFDSVKNLVVHIVIAVEFNIKSFIKNVAVQGEELYETLGNLSKSDLLEEWEKADNMLLDTVRTVKEPIPFPNFVDGGEVLIEPEDFFLQYITHTQYHRGQLMSLLKLLGKEGVTTDYLFYLFQTEG